MLSRLPPGSSPCPSSTAGFHCSGVGERAAVKLGLGTAQFGMNYGVSNKNGQPNIEEVSKILALAMSTGIRVIDTAPIYGTSE